MSATATRTKAKPPVPASQRVFEVELGFPVTETQTVFQVEAGTEAEAADILCDWFRRGLRVLKG